MTVISDVRTALSFYYDGEIAGEVYDCSNSVTEIIMGVEGEFTQVITDVDATIGLNEVFRSLSLNVISGDLAIDEPGYRREHLP